MSERAMQAISRAMQQSASNTPKLPELRGVLVQWHQVPSKEGRLRAWKRRHLVSVGCHSASSHKDSCHILESLPGAGQLPLQRSSHLLRPSLQYCGLPMTATTPSLNTCSSFPES